jgi:hypothetical protein
MVEGHLAHAGMQHFGVGVDIERLGLDVLYAGFGTVISSTSRQPNGTQINDGMNVNASRLLTTTTSCACLPRRLSSSAVVSPAKLPPMMIVFVMTVLLSLFLARILLRKKRKYKRYL